jgi:hypothetical protein
MMEDRQKMNDMASLGILFEDYCVQELSNKTSKAMKFKDFEGKQKEKIVFSTEGIQILSSMGTLKLRDGDYIYRSPLRNYRKIDFIIF